MNIEEIKIKFLPSRKLVEMMLFKEGKDLKAIIEQGGEIHFEADAVTKTMVSTHVFHGHTNLKVNIESEKFKTAERSVYNYFSCSSTTNHYFKLSKKQGAEQYKEYIKEVIAYIEKVLKVEIKQTEFIVFTKVFESEAESGA